MRQTKRFTAIALLLSFSVLVLAGCSKTESTEDVFGKSVNLAQHHKKWLIINYWAEWCKPCVEEFPVFNQLSKNHSQHVIVVGVNYDQLPSAKQRQIALHYSIRYPLLKQNIGQQYGLGDTSVLPTTYVIAPNGKLEKILKGPQSLKALEKTIGLS